MMMLDPRSSVQYRCDTASRHNTTSATKIDHTSLVLARPRCSNKNNGASLCLLTFTPHTIRAMISMIMVLNQKGDIMISRQYR